MFNFTVKLWNGVYKNFENTHPEKCLQHRSPNCYSPLYSYFFCPEGFRPFAFNTVHKVDHFLVTGQLLFGVVHVAALHRLHVILTELLPRLALGLRQRTLHGLVPLLRLGLQDHLLIISWFSRNSSSLFFQ